MEFHGSLFLKCTGDVKLEDRAEDGRRQPLTLHCQECNTVLGDSHGVCGEIECLDSIICIEVTNDIVVGDAMQSREKGEMTNCIYSSLKCRGCCTVVGKVIQSAPPHLAMVRSLFLLSKANISCYTLNSSSMVKASTLTFDQRALTERIHEVKQQFQAQLDRMSLVKSRLADRRRISGFKK